MQQQLSSESSARTAAEQQVQALQRQLSSAVADCSNCKEVCVWDQETMHALSISVLAVAVLYHKPIFHSQKRPLMDYHVQLCIREALRLTQLCICEALRSIELA